MQKKITLAENNLRVKLERNSEIEIDTAAFLSDAEDKTTEADLVFYGNENHNSGGVIHNADDSISIDLSKIPAQIVKITFTATIYEPQETKHNFSQVGAMNLKIYNIAGTEIFAFPISTEKNVTTIILGDFCRQKNCWTFEANGAFYPIELKDICKIFGLNVEGEVEENNIKPEEVEKFSKDYSEKSFFDKSVGVVKKAGLELIYKALQLYYVTQKPNCPTRVKAAIYGTLGMFIAPLDFIPDFMPIMGFTDDAGAIAVALTIAHFYIDDEVKKNAKDRLQSLFGKEILSELKV